MGKTKSNFLEAYKSEMIQIIQRMDPDIDAYDINETLDKMIQKRIVNPQVTLDNNYTHESRDTNLLAVLDWSFDRKPIMAGNGTFYKNQHEAVNPVANMLKQTSDRRDMFKGMMFQIEDFESKEYKELDRKQGNEKVNNNSWYGGSGNPAAPFYSKWSAPATTHTAQMGISTTEQLFEGFIADNYIYMNTDECLEWCEKMLREEDPDDEGIILDDFIPKRGREELYKRLYDNILNTDDSTDKILNRYIRGLDENDVTFLYYKNNMMQFIDNCEVIQDLINQIFQNIPNYDYINDDIEDWINHLPDGCEDFHGTSAKDWNKFVNKSYFMDPNNPPSEISGLLAQLSAYMMKYVYCRYCSPDRIYRLKNFKRQVVTVIDTDSNILALDPLIDYIMGTVTHKNTFGRSELHNTFICINMIAYLITDAVTDILYQFGVNANVPEDYRDLYKMKNEFLFLKLIIAEAKKRYLSRIALREGNYMNPPKYDIKGFDFKKSTCSERSEKAFMKIIKKTILDTDQPDITDLVSKVYKFANEVRQTIQDGKKDYLPLVSVKDPAAFKNPEREQSVRGSIVWNALYPDNMIDPPTKCSIIKLNLLTEQSMEAVKEKYPREYEIIMDTVFRDTTGIFISKKHIEELVDYVDVTDPDWNKSIPKKYRAEYRKLGPDAWNKFVEQYDGPLDIGGDEVKCKGFQVLAIPGNSDIPEWIREFIDYETIINNICSPMLPVLKIFGIKSLQVGGTVGSVDRKSEAFTNIVKF